MNQPKVNQESTQSQPCFWRQTALSTTATPVDDQLTGKILTTIVLPKSTRQPGNVPLSHTNDFFFMNKVNSLTVMLATLIGMVLFSHTLFLSVFPPSMATWERMLATWFMAIGWEATVLITTVNTRHLNKNIPWIMAICSGLIVLFFIQAFDTTQPWLTIAQRWLVGSLAAAINYIYADLFYAKWNERTELIERPMKLTDLQSRVDEFH